MKLKSMFAAHGGGKIDTKWTYDAKAPIVSPPAIGDLSGTGHPHIVFGTKKGTVICLNHEGKELWTFNASQQLSQVDSFFVDEDRVHSIDAAPVIADITRDGHLEILVGTEQGTLYCLSANGRMLWSHDCGGSIKASVTVDDINSDGHPEILVTSTNNKLTILRSTGEKIFEFMEDAALESVPGVLKSKKTGRTMIVFGNNNGELIAITPGQEIIWRVPLESKITSAPTFFTADEEDRMVIGTHAGDLVCLSEHGEIVWTFNTEGSIYNAATVADLNKDNDPEIVFSSCDNTVYAVSSQGKRVWSYETNFWVTTTPIVTDLDKDGHLEVVVGSYDHNLYVLDGTGTYVFDYVPGLSGIVNQAGHYSNILTSDPGEQTGKKIWQYMVDSIIVGCALLEPENEKQLIIITTKNGKVHGISHEED
ncbi:PQQ-binding-like beta-propeller repeat protein [Candidatus Woesearchaeota archaeon]|nr:PQQ-binding-like beta-propeller repeat protein [Candidatus Woesearchaeota archaeon]